MKVSGDKMRKDAPTPQIPKTMITTSPDGPISIRNGKIGAEGLAAALENFC